MLLSPLCKTNTSSAYIFLCLHAEVLSPAVVTVSESTTNSVRVSWGPVQPDSVQSIQVEYSALPAGKLQIAKVNKQQNYTVLRNLQPDTQYLVTVSAKYASGGEKAMSVKACTQEGMQLRRRRNARGGTAVAWEIGVWKLNSQAEMGLTSTMPLNYVAYFPPFSLSLSPSSSPYFYWLSLSLSQCCQPLRICSSPQWEATLSRSSGRGQRTGCVVTGLRGREIKAMRVRQPPSPPSISRPAPCPQRSKMCHPVPASAYRPSIALPGGRAYAAPPTSKVSVTLVPQRSRYFGN